MNRVPWALSCAFSLALVACTTTPPAPQSAATVTPSATHPAKAATPKTAPAASAEAPPSAAPKEEAPKEAALPSDPGPEPLAPPVDTRWKAPGSRSDAGDAAGHGGLGLSGADKKGSGGVVLSGVGEGGGGRGEGIGLGSVGTVGRGAGTGSGSGFGSGSGRLGAVGGVRSGGGGGGGSAGGFARQVASVKTGEWDDNANFREFTRWLASEKQPGVAKIDASARRFLVVRDAAGKPVPSCSVKVSDGAGKSVNVLTTSNGRALFFPAAENLKRGGLVATARCQGGVATQTFTSAPGDAVVELNLPGMRALPQAQTLDVAFILDTTGSMSEEIDALRETLQKVADQVKGLNVRVRVGLVEFKDRGDTYVTRMHQMTTDIAGMQARIAQIEASGGGDEPEHVNQAVRVAVNGLAWKPESIARLAFLIGDAPPHLDYQDDEGYAGAVKEANHEGIQIYTIAASGMDPVGQVVWRQLAQLTAATHMFVLRGGAGPQSTGGGDPRDSCGGTHTDYRSGALDALIASKIRGALAARDADPMRIAGLGKDEKEKPCDQRVVMAR